MFRFNPPLAIDQLQTSRLCFRQLQAQDLQPWTAFCADPASMQFLPLPPGSPDTQAREWFSRNAKRWTNNGTGFCAIVEKQTQRFLGLCGLLVQEVDGKPELEIAYHLLPQSRGQGFALEAAQALRNFVFEHHVAASLVSIIHTGNLPSQKLAWKNGLRSTHQTTFSQLPVFIYRISRQQWEQARDQQFENQRRFDGADALLSLRSIGMILAFLFIGSGLLGFALKLITGTSHFFAIGISCFILLGAGLFGTRVVFDLFGVADLFRNNPLPPAERRKKFHRKVRVATIFLPLLALVIFGICGWLLEGVTLSALLYLVLGCSYALLLRFFIISGWIRVSDLPDEIW